ncbi:MAG TPA: hypothetical protein VNT79_13550 [Phycisphaerae bacterium]|nr:hypothetical protein [Phycisphaerae bacterium]
MDWLAVWPRFCALLATLFLARGLFVMSVLPPYEGWDEYQHIAYLEYLVDHKQLPVLGESRVPVSLYPELVRFPHSPFGAEQVRRIGGVSYDEFWKLAGPPAVRGDVKPLLIYQSQQAPLYYRLVAPLYDRLRTGTGMLGAITGLRLLNVGFGAIALGAALWSIGMLFRPGPHRYIVGLLIATQPLYLINVARVANDALALMLGSVAIAVLISMNAKWAWHASVIAGSALGLAILSKANVLGLAPFVLCAFALAWAGRRLTWRASLAGAVICLAICGAITYRYFSYNLERFDMLSPLQEAVENVRRGRQMSLWQAAGEMDWRRDFFMRLFRQSLWRGGWSMLGLDGQVLGVNRPLVKIHGMIVVIAMAAGCSGWIFAKVTASLGLGTWKGRRLARAPDATPSRALRAGNGSPLHDRVHVALIWAMFLSMLAGLSYHALQSQMAVGDVGTNAWYAAVIFPWLLAVIYVGLTTLPWPRAAQGLAGIFLLNQVIAELYGTLFIMPPAYTGERWNELARARLAQMHFSGMGPSITMPSLSIGVVIVALAILVWIRQMPRSAVKTPA